MIHRWCGARFVAAIVCFGGAFAAAPAAAEPAEFSGFIENATHLRNDRGLSKARNTLQIEGHRAIGRVGIFHDVSVSGTLRATYDAVYDLHDSEFGRNAGGNIVLESGGDPRVDHGAGVVLPGGDFDNAANPNTGLRVLGFPLHETSGGVAFTQP